MVDITVKVDIPVQFKDEFELALAKVTDEFVEKIRAETLLSLVNSKEEKELTEWSVELGRKAKKGRFKRILEELTPEERKKLLESMPQDKRKEYE